MQHRTARSLLVKPSALRTWSRQIQEGEAASLQHVRGFLSVGRTVSPSPSPVRLILQLARPVLPRLSELITIP